MTGLFGFRSIVLTGQAICNSREVAPRGELKNLTILQEHYLTIAKSVKTQRDQHKMPVLVLDRPRLEFNDLKDCRL